MPIYRSHPIDDFLSSSQSSAGTVGGSGSDAEHNFSNYHKFKLKFGTGRSSMRLKTESASIAVDRSNHVHNYNTRFQPSPRTKNEHPTVMTHPDLRSSRCYCPEGILGFPTATKATRKLVREPIFDSEFEDFRDRVRERVQSLNFHEVADRERLYDELAGVYPSLRTIDDDSQQTLLQEQAVARGDRVIYGVEFHPELAPIDAAYRSIAKAMRVTNSAKSTAGF
ncbi:hypothetical protein Pmar_PMAR021837 [Perkinsus marinus ATCC 50983]|uniref:Glutamine amidotransferase domain-containing protein n=1 Tax=Perkinsus marinus (strain ATCC 50983 / TXsc) TaxID=423536 RepID=C5LG75_PERM5|nr:hypothetical protein Pmar_PMAR021837 [Perkinsus marinus ATCC 50983]EER04330.1 hypothetical protein Pmar_PMAR021837 [Perkinsus marinus ATCC 50983]|eukprot:XP_002772514.1 hypothetical protein Pmar_PMAR021837 [Perkinsus marinus ATCC 50983]